MAVDLNHTIIPTFDRRASARFLAGILGLRVRGDWGPFTQVETHNGVTLDFAETDEFRVHHYAFLVSDDEFDAAFGRITQAGLPYWADPFHGVPNEINRLYEGRGVYFDDPNGHNIEIITRPYA
jgi:catechol 2,3-dioxygenase-like lactoylglutathione lyase family enzyme